MYRSAGCKKRVNTDDAVVVLFIDQANLIRQAELPLSGESPPAHAWREGRPTHS